MNKIQLAKLISINLNFIIGLILFSLLIFNNICPIYVGFFFMFSLVFMYIELYDINEGFNEFYSKIN